MLRVRFKVNEVDYRPVSWPVKHPYWCSGYGDDHAIVISYADDEEYVYENWPEAIDLDSTEVDCYHFSDRFPKPDWFKDPVENKRILKEIAKRYAKSVLLESEAHIHFEGSALTDDEISYVEGCLRKLGERITDLDPVSSSIALVAEYFEYV